MSRQLPALLIVIEVEGAPRVFRTGNNDDWRRLCHWILSHDSLIDLLDAAYDAQPVEPDSEDSEGVVLAIVTYARWPHPRDDDLELVSPARLESIGASAAGGRITDWDPGRYPFDPTAAPAQPGYRPGSRFTPSLELRWRLGAEE